MLRAHLRLVLLRQYLHSHTTANEQPPSFFHIIYTMRIYLVHGFTLIPSSTITSWKLLTPSLPQLKHFPEGKDAQRNIFRVYTKPTFGTVHFDAKLSSCEKLKDFKFHILLPGIWSWCMHGSEGVNRVIALIIVYRVKCLYSIAPYSHL